MCVLCCEDDGVFICGQAASLSEDPVVSEASFLENIQHKSITGITHRLTPLVSDAVSQSVCVCVCVCVCAHVSAFHYGMKQSVYSLFSQVGEKVSRYARYIFEPVDTNWSVVYEDGDMKVYRREMEEGGVVVDPLKSFYTATVSNMSVHIGRSVSYQLYIYMYMYIGIIFPLRYYIMPVYNN